MPKKTKKQKLDAVKRRKPITTIYFSSSKQHISPTVQHENLEKATPSLVVSSSPRMPLFSGIEKETHYFKQDFSKSMILVGILLSFQIGLALMQFYGYFDFNSVIHF